MDIVARAKALIVSPKTEWPRIAAEPATTGGLFTGYAMILAAIPAIAGFIGISVIGFSVRGQTFHLPASTALFQAIVQYVLGLVGLWLFGKIIEILAPTFGGARDEVAAMKVAVYGATAVWLAGIFSLIPMIAVLGILGLYSLYLIYTGLPVLMRCPPEKALVYTAAVVVCGIVITLLISGVSSWVLFRQHNID